MAADDRPGGRGGVEEGAAHVAMMRQDVVARCGWMGDQEFLDLMAGVEA